MAQILSDEFGQSFQLNDDTLVVKGKECIFANINTVKSIASFIGTSLGPTGMDKIFIDENDRITVTNDGATILKEMGMSSNPISQLILQLSQSQDEEIGDGTTSIVVLASAILEQARILVEKGMHPIKIAEGFNTALSLSLDHLNKISEEISDLNGTILRAAKTSLGSKIVSKTNLGSGNISSDFLSSLCVDASLAVADLPRKDLDLDLINIQTKAGRGINDSRLINGMLLKKEFSHPQMEKIHKNVRIALLSCPFEPPRLKNKNSLLIQSAEEYKNLENYEKTKFLEMIESLKRAKTDLVVCQWGFDDEANSLLMQNSISAIRWVGGHDLGLLATHIGGQIISRFEDLKEEHLGVANAEEISIGTDDSKFIVIEGPSKNKAVTLLIRGSTEYIVEECKRSVRDALCSIRNIIRNSRIVYGGGSSDMSVSIFLEKKAKEYDAEDEEAIRAFSTALIEIPLTLAKNSGYDSVTYIENLKEPNSKDFTLGVDCMETGEKNMKKNGIFESLESKRRQFTMACDLVNMILKVNDIIQIN